MRVLYLNYEWDPGESPGAFTHMRELSKGLAALGHTVVVKHRHRLAEGAEGAPSVGKPRREKLSRLRSRLSRYFHESAALWRAFRGIQEETKLIRRERPDIVLTRYSLHQFSSLVAARRCGVPVVFEVNAPSAFEYRQHLPQYLLVPWFAEWLEAHTLRRSDGLFVVSEILKHHLVERAIPEEKISIVPNGADTSIFRPDITDLAVRERLGSGSVVLGFVGSFARFHGIGQLREAIDFLTARKPEASFLMVGSGELSDDLEEHCRQRGLERRVYFTGQVAPQRVPGLMAAADILLAPYEADGFFYFSPIKVFEYMATGRAVLAAHVGQVGKVIRDGVDGVLYDPTDLNSLRSALLRLVEDSELRRRLGESARRTIEDRYTWRVNVKGVSDALERAQMIWKSQRR